MKIKLSCKIISIVLVIVTLMTALPLNIFASELNDEKGEEQEVYIKSVKLSSDILGLSKDGYVVLPKDLNQGTSQGSMYLGYQTTTDPAEAIYDMKLMNMNGGFSLTSMKEALSVQESEFAAMASDLNYLVEEFVKAYKEGSLPAQKAYKALNFFRVVAGETELVEENGLGYQIVHSGITQSTLTEIIMFCDPAIVDSIVKILTMGIQIRNGNWMEKLSQKGPYEDDTVYMEDEDELRRRAEQLLVVLEIYSEAYNTMVKSGLMPDDLDKDFNPVYNDDDKPNDIVPAEEADIQKLDDSRYKFYKIAADELEKYKYGDNGETLKDFFVSIADGISTKKLYPLVSVLSDGEFSALSYGCFLELVTGANATYDDFDSYDELYEALTEEASSVYLYGGVDQALFDEEAIVGFTDTAQRHMAATGELDFFEKLSSHEKFWEDGKRVATCIAAAGMTVIGVGKLTVGVVGIVGFFSATVANAAGTGIFAGVMKFCTIISGGKALLIMLAAVALAVGVSYIVAAVDEWLNGVIDWEDNPMPKYLYDVKEVTLSQSSDDGITTEFMKRPVFALYEAVTDLNGEVVDLNVRSKEASQWIALYVSRDRQGEEAKPIKADDLLVQTSSGETPDGYVPLTRFGEVIAYNLNEWDAQDTVNGVYVFYKQDQSVAVDSGKNYYIYDVYLQQGESDTHCIKLLEAAGYTPLNVNLSPALKDSNTVFSNPIYTYLGYKVTTNKESAIRDIRMVYGPSRGEISYGNATYAESGSNGVVTLYATKYKTAGTPILAGGIICQDRQFLNIPEGYEPVCKMTGGPAVTLNVGSNGKVSAEHEMRFLYFLPETTFTSGKQYVGDIALFQPDNKIQLNIQLPPEAMDYWAEYQFVAGDTKNWVNSVAYYPTYNPYRAVYGIKAALHNEYTDTLTLNGNSYLAWNRISWGHQVDAAALTGQKMFYLTVQHTNPELLKGNGAFYLMGNPDPSNEYDPITKAMMKVQPLELSDISCLYYNKGATSASGGKAPDSFIPVTDVFSNSTNAARVTQDLTKYEFEIYTSSKNKEIERPYVSNICAVDELTLYRAYGGYDAGASFDTINDGMLYAQLANQGATNFNSYKAVLRQTDFWDSDFLDSYDEINAIRFGYTRTDKTKEALRDVFLYFNGFSTDEPPKELYRGSTKYKLLCEIPYNLTGYDDAPKPGVYVYGTTDSKAGNRIIDFEVSGTPFMDGYETVRTMNGRSLVAEIKDYALNQKSFLSFFRDAETHSYMYNTFYNYINLFDVLYHYFSNDDGKQQNGYFYLHIKREGDDLSKQKPYIENLHVAYCDEDKATALDTLFDLGAEGYVDLDLNKDAGGDYVYVGYSYTSDPAKAIKEIRAYHEEDHPATLTDDYGRKFTLVSDIDINKDAGGDYIYLYTTKGSSNDDPISSISAAFKVNTGKSRVNWVDGSSVTATTYCTKHWDSNKDSDLNRRAGGKYIYLMYTTVDSSFKGTAKTLKYGKDKTYSRDAFENQNETGKYIGGVYVMDKLTILEEKIAAGELSSNSSCDSIKDQEVFDRLKKMGATKVLETPICVNDHSYFKWNPNKVFIGYSRTNTKSDAITNLAIKAEILSISEPKEKISVKNKQYEIVAEAADEVTELPRAINLLAIPTFEDMVLPRLYLYYSTDSGSDPICDISIDDIPILNGWNTVRSANIMDPFADIYYQAYEQYELADKDDSDFYDSEIVYTDALYRWMEVVAGVFDPEDARAKPFYIHVKRHSEESLEDLKPYIGEVFIAEGDSRHEALSKLVAFEPDGFVDVDLNLTAGGNYVYMAYKRVAKARDALTDIVVYEGKKFEPSRRITVGDKSAKFTLAADIDLNSEAGGEYLYLYTTDSSNTGNPITNLDVKTQVDSYLKCGVERVTVKRADGDAYTDEYIDLNKSAGGDYIYMIMTRETTEGHTSDEIVTEQIVIDPTCIEDGCRIEVTSCVDCGARMETVQEVLKAHGAHIDADDDGDHDCDVCDRRDVSDHTVKGYLESDPDNRDQFKLVFRCSECDEATGEEYNVEGSYAGPGIQGVAALLGGGSVIAICLLAGVAIFAIIFMFLKKRKTINNPKEND